MSDSLTHFITICPNCSSQLRVRRRFLDKPVLCKQCRHTFTGTAMNAAAEAGSAEAMAGAQTPRPPGEDERILVVCGSCKTHLSVRRSRMGDMITCKVCGQVNLAQPSFEPDAGSGLTSPSQPRLEDTTGVANQRSDLGNEPLGTERRRLQDDLEQLYLAQGSLKTELERIAPAYQFLRTELEQAQLAYKQLLAENLRLGEVLDAAKRHAAESAIAHEQATSEAEERNQQLVEAQTRLESDFQSRLDADRGRGAQLEQELLAFRSVRAGQEEEHLRHGEADPIAAAPTAHDPSLQRELESARAEIERLKSQLRESNRLQGEMATLFDGLGLRFELGP
jgi:ribosomal protein L37AE/L43A